MLRMRGTQFVVVGKPLRTAAPKPQRDPIPHPLESQYGPTVDAMTPGELDRLLAGAVAAHWRTPQSVRAGCPAVPLELAGPASRSRGRGRGKVPGAVH